MTDWTHRAPPLSPLYAILDPGQIGERPWEPVLEWLLEGGARTIQLRAKELPANALLEIARRARGLTRDASCLFIVNDRLDIALAVEADGVHLGQEDLPLGAARKIAGRKMLIGISTHDLAQAIAADRGGADYIGFGPIFGTATKATGYSPRGSERLREICRAVRIPVVAIGGISEANVQQVWEAGAASAAMIGDLMGADNVAGKVRRILSLRED